MILERIYEVAKPRLAGRRVIDIRIGLHLIAVELDGGPIGVTYVLRNETGHNCPDLSQAGNINRDVCDEIATWVLKGVKMLSIPPWDWQY